MAFHRILCPIDFSDPARVAMRTALDLARESGGTVVLLHVLDFRRLFVSDTMVSPRLFEEVEADARASLAEWRREAEAVLGPARVAGALVQGVPWDAIVRALQDDPRVDLVVLGTHGRTGLKHVLLGSVAEKVVRHARCAALVARA